MNINKKIEDKDFKKMIESKLIQITIDLKDREYLTRKEIAGLLVLDKIGKKIKLINANPGVVDLIKLLDFEDVINIK
ncbi:MAG: hypothetical protein KAT05_08765 [Spirochaetes bacterium]|nr:hypothetical protein [Spirochaetota bacterium]